MTLSLGVLAVAVATAYFLSSPQGRSEPAPPPAPGNPSTVGNGPNARDVRAALLKEFQTVTLKNCTLKRYGGTGAKDESDIGGYLMCANLADGIQSAYSYGIAGEDSWGCQVSRDFGITIHQYDCFNDDRPSCDGGAFVFHDECVGAKAETIDGRPFDTIPSQIVRNGDAGKVLLVKVDVEGAEWDSLMATPDAVLDSIVQMPMEFHGTNEAKFVAVVRRLKRQFHLVNLHFNNYACSSDVAPFPAWAYQALWVNKRVGVLDPEGPSPALMSPLNVPDRPDAQDCQLAPPAP